MTTTNHDPEKAVAELEFFSYHEYLVTGGSSKLVVTHFPNPYTNDPSRRVVRVPRVYHQNLQSDVIPQFSIAIPGQEKSAITDNTESFNPLETVEGQIYGRTSWTPLVPGFISKKQFVEIATEVNQYLVRAFTPLAVSVVENVLDILLGGVALMITGSSYTKRELERLEEYVKRVNQEISPVEIVLPRRLGYLGLDFIIPEPTT